MAFPAGMHWLPSNDDDGEGVPEHRERCVSWTPTRGQEGFMYSIMFHGSDLFPMKTLDKCVKVNVMRCVYCAVEGDSMMSIASSYGLDWLQLWGANPTNAKNPDGLYEGQEMHLGPIYT